MFSGFEVVFQASQISKIFQEGMPPDPLANFPPSALGPRGRCEQRASSRWPHGETLRSQEGGVVATTNTPYSELFLRKEITTSSHYLHRLRMLKES